MPAPQVPKVQVPQPQAIPTPIFARMEEKDIEEKYPEEWANRVYDENRARRTRLESLMNAKNLLMIRRAKTYGREKVMERFGTKIKAATLYSVAADTSFRIGTYYAGRTDGATDRLAEKQYWMMAGPMMLTNGAPYIFGTFKLDKEDPDPVKMRQELEALGDLTLDALQIKMPETHGWWTVACKYEPGAGVGGHKDSDFDSEFPWIITIAPVGHAKFKVRAENQDGSHTRFEEVTLNDSSVLVFDRSVEHRVDGAEDNHVRVSFTLRGARYGRGKVFHRLAL